MNTDGSQEKQCDQLKEMEMRKYNLIPVLVTTTLLLILVVGPGGVVGFTYEDKEVETEQGRAAMFERWRSHHKLEEISPQEKKTQYEMFKSRLEQVHQTNKANLGYKFELNRFAGMTHEQLQSHMGLKKAPLPKIKHGMKEATTPGIPSDWYWPYKYANVTDVPDRIDWREYNAVTRVKNQGQCGSCYSFPAVDTVEGLHAIQTKELVELSPKEIVDCANVGGCNGGTVQASYQYMIDKGGLTTEKNYPYVAKQETCRLQKEKDIAVEIHGYEDIPRNAGDEYLLKAVAHQPVAVSVCWVDKFMQYKSGILSGPCGLTMEHSILVVGYDTAPDGTKYWIAKNSYGEGWGDKGYVKFIRGVPEKEGFCGVMAQSTYPTRECDSGKHADPGAVVHLSKEL